MAAATTTIGYVSSDKFQANNKKEEHAPTKVTQDAAKEFRESMKVGENTTYDYDTDIIQVNPQRGIEDEGR